MNDLTARIIPVTDLRRNFGRVTARLPYVDSLILTKGGEAFATLKAVPAVKLKLLKKSAGAWKGTMLDRDDVWREVSKKRSRRRPIVLAP